MQITLMDELRALASGINLKSDVTRCTCCGELKDSWSGYYHRCSSTRQHKEGAIMQPCITCKRKQSKFNRQRRKNNEQRARKGS